MLPEVLLSVSHCFQRAMKLQAGSPRWCGYNVKLPIPISVNWGELYQGISPCQASQHLPFSNRLGHGSECDTCISPWLSFATLYNHLKEVPYAMDDPGNDFRSTSSKRWSRVMHGAPGNEDKCLLQPDSIPPTYNSPLSLSICWCGHPYTGNS